MLFQSAFSVPIFFLIIKISPNDKEILCTNVELWSTYFTEWRKLKISVGRKSWLLFTEKFGLMGWRRGAQIINVRNIKHSLCECSKCDWREMFERDSVWYFSCHWRIPYSSFEERRWSKPKILNLFQPKGECPRVPLVHKNTYFHNGGWLFM